MAKYVRIVVVIIITIVNIITFMQDIYNYITKQTMFLGYILFQLFCIYN
jgi:hypothetical protein